MKNLKFKNNLVSKQGFTLIELLVVVAIIGILASVVMAMTSTSRSKSQDASVKSNLSGIRQQAELLYDANGAYDVDTTPTAFALAQCASTANTMFANTTIWAQISKAVSSSGKAITTSRCYTNATSAWLVAVPLNSSATLGWCVDSAGKSQQVTMSAVTSVTSCP